MGLGSERFNALTNHLPFACSFSSAHIVQSATYHAFASNFAKATAGHAAAGRGALSACVAPAVHFRAAVPQHAGTRASSSSHVLLDSRQTQLPGLACPRRFLPTCHRRVDPRLCRARRWHIQFDPARFATSALHQFRTGNAVSHRSDRHRRVVRRNYGRDRSARRKSARALREPKARTTTASSKSRSISFGITRSGNAGGSYGFDIRERSVATATRARRTFSQSTPPFPHHIFARRNRKRRCIGRDSALRDASVQDVCRLPPLKIAQPFKGGFYSNLPDTYPDWIPVDTRLTPGHDNAAEGIVRLHVNWLLLCRNCGVWRTMAARVRSWIDNR